MEKQITNDPLINLNRFVNYKLILMETELIIEGFVLYKHNDGTVKDLKKPPQNFRYTTKDTFVDSNGVILQKDANGGYPIGAIPQLLFFQSLPKTAFPQLAVWDIVLYLIGDMIDTLVTNGKFDNL